MMWPLRGGTAAPSHNKSKIISQKPPLQIKKTNIHFSSIP
jgi:hypothetical protein